MKLNPIQRAFARDNKIFPAGITLTPSFNTSFKEIVEAANELANQLPILKSVYSNGSIHTFDRIVPIVRIDEDTLLSSPTLKLCETDEGYWVGFNHDLLDGWGYTKACCVLYEIAATGKVGTYQSQVDVPKRVLGGPATPRLQYFAGERGISPTFKFDIGNRYKSMAKARGMRIQDLLGEWVSRELGGVNILFSTMETELLSHIGHYSMYGLASYHNDQYQVDVSPENYTRYLAAKGVKGQVASFFVTSIPCGDCYLTPEIYTQYLEETHIGRVMIVSANGTSSLFVTLNKALPNKESFCEKIYDYLK